MAVTINNLQLPDHRILVLPDEGDNPTTGVLIPTGTIFRRSTMGGGHFMVGSGDGLGSETEYSHVLFVKEMATEVEIDEVEYMAMHENAVVGLIPD